MMWQYLWKVTIQDNCHITKLTVTLNSMDSIEKF